LMEHINKKDSSRIGSGWPSAFRRWCTREKVERGIDPYCKSIGNVIQCIGYAFDEPQRTLSKPAFLYRFPLQEYEITEQQALAYCLKHGFDWGGLYEIFNRVSCFCCPLQRMSELRKLRRHFPDLWAKMLKWDREMPDNRGFKDYTTVNDLENRFREREKSNRVW